MNQSQGRPAAPEDGPTKAPEELRTLAAWYRDYAERAGSTLVWDYRLSTAEDLERQASALELQGNRFQEARTAPSQTSAVVPASHASLAASIASISAWSLSRYSP